MSFSPENPLSAEPEIETSHPDEFVEQLRCVADTLPARINIDAQSVEQGLAKLVLTLIEFIRRLYRIESEAREAPLRGGRSDGHAQAVRRVEGELAALGPDGDQEVDDVLAGRRLSPLRI